MSSLLARLKSLAAYEPALLAWATSGGLAVVCAFLFHLSSTQEAAVTTIATAAAAAYSAVMARPVAVPVILGALVTAVTAASAFGLHLTAEQAGAGAAVVSGLLGLLFRANLTPAAATTRPHGVHVRLGGTAARVVTPDGTLAPEQGLLGTGARLSPWLRPGEGRAFRRPRNGVSSRRSH